MFDNTPYGLVAVQMVHELWQMLLRKTAVPVEETCTQASTAKCPMPAHAQAYPGCPPARSKQSPGLETTITEAILAR